MLPILNVIIASTRPGRIGPSVARWVEQVAAESGLFEVRLVVAHPSQRRYEHEHTRRWSQSVGSADAFLFVTPEYDYFAPASLVNAIQVLFHEWAYKPAAVVSYGGVSGGLRGTQALRSLLGNLNAVAINQPVPVPFVRQYIGEDGVFRPEPIVRQGTDLLLAELQKWTLALQGMRKEKLSSAA